MAVEGKRTQSDYTLAFKLGGVSAVEKGEMTDNWRHAIARLSPRQAGRRNKATRLARMIIAV